MALERELHPRKVRDWSFAPRPGWGRVDLLGRGQFSGEEGGSGECLNSKHWGRGAAAQNGDLGVAPTALTTKVIGDGFQIIITSRIHPFPGTA